MPWTAAFTFNHIAYACFIFRRLDYFILSEKLVPNLCDSVIRSDVYGSDHCPITLLINI